MAKPSRQARGPRKQAHKHSPKNESPQPAADKAKKKANDVNNSDTLKAYFKVGTRLGYVDGDTLQDQLSPQPDAADDVVDDRQEEKKDGGKQLMQEAKTIDLSNPMHVPRCLRIAEKHKKIADKWKNRATAEARRCAKEENADPRRGLKKVAKQISRHAANSLRYVARDTKAAGRKAGTLTSNPKIIDGVITRAWREVYEGNAKDPDALVEAFV